MSRRFVRLAAALGALALMTGCELKGQLVVSSDGSGFFKYTVALDRARLDDLAPGVDPLGEVRRAAAAQSFPIEVVEFDNDAEVGVTARFGFEDGKELRTRLDDVHVGGTRLASTYSLADLVVRQTRNGWYLQATTVERARAVSELPFDLDDFEKPQRAIFTATLPGHDRDENAYRLRRHSGRTSFTWRIGSETGLDRYHLRAETIVPHGSGSPWPALAVVSGLMVGVPVWLRVRRSVP